MPRNDYDLGITLIITLGIVISIGIIFSSLIQSEENRIRRCKLLLDAQSMMIDPNLKSEISVSIIDTCAKE